VFVGLQLRLITDTPLLVALWDTKRQKCTSNPACELWDEMMLLDTREREREANANRVAQAAARPAPAVRAAHFRALWRVDSSNPPPEMLGGIARLPQPRPEPPRPEPPRPEPPAPPLNFWLQRWRGF
jgi:hypothetical protein